MQHSLKIVSWNVEHFRMDPARVERVIGFLAGLKPDVFALLEVEGKEVYEALVRKMPRYQFHITDTAEGAVLGVPRAVS